MDRLISEQEVLDVIASWFESVEQQRILQGRIKAIPSAEPKIGHWVLGICDTCGYDWGKDAPIASVPNFCPNCGCHMDEPQESEE